MVRGKFEKITALLIAAYIIVSTYIFTPDWSCVGISTKCDMLQRLSYSFVHASLLHAMLNAWCLISIVFIYKVSFSYLIMAYIIAVIAPDIVLLPNPTVGLSAVCFALLGLIAFRVENKLRYNAYMVLYIAAGFVFPLINGWLHLYSYIAGMFISLLNMPIPCRKK